MRVSVVYFALAQDLAAKAREVLSVSEGASLGTLVAEIMKLHPHLKDLRGSVRFSVNMAIAEIESRLKEGDEVGVLPPVAGG